MSQVDPEDLDKVDVALIVESNVHFANAIEYFEQAIVDYAECDDPGERTRIAFIAICNIGKEFGASLHIELIKNGEPSIN